MKYFIKTGRIFYAIALIAYGTGQFIYGDFRDVLFPPWQQQLPLPHVWAYAFGLYLIISGVAIIIDKKARMAALIASGVFCFIFFFLHIPYELISQPNKIYHFGLWVTPLKELALSGGGFVITASYQHNHDNDKPIVNDPFLIKLLNSIVPYGNIFFAFTIASFGIGHFMYSQFIVTIVPAWFADRIFWTYFSGMALASAGIFIILNIRMRVVALLLSIMLFLWIWLVHLPGALDDPRADRGNNIFSTFDALAFSGIALVIAFTLKKQKWIEDIENYK